MSTAQTRSQLPSYWKVFRLAPYLLLMPWLCAASTARAQADDAIATTIAIEESTKTAQAATDEKAPAVKWMLGASGGLMVRSADDTQPFVAAGISRKIGRGYVRLSGTTYRSTFRQVDAVLPSRFAIGSVSAGGTFGLWFVDGYASYGRQTYDGVKTPLGIRERQVGSGSPVMGAGVSGGRFISLGHRWWLTATGGLQVSQNRALRQRLDTGRPVDYETREHAVTGSGTLRLDRYFGKSSQHIAGLSISRVQTSNGAVSISGRPGAATTPVSVPDGWAVIGASASFRMTPHLWLDSGVTRTIGAQAGNITVPVLGLRFGF